MAEFLFVGGYADGEWRNIPDDRTSTIITETVYQFPIKDRAAYDAAQKKHSYEKLTLTFPSGSQSFFFSHKISAAVAIHQLLHGYTPHA
jgi:predicted NAD/FAD-binding protein